jgi:hypothetical protein
MSYLPWVNSNDPTFAMISESLPRELEELSGSFNGNDESLEGRFPTGLVLDLSKAGGKKLGDFVRNTDNMLIVSEKLKGILERNSTDFEFYAVSIRNHKKRVEPARYFLAHLRCSVPCLNVDASEVRWSALVPGQARRIARLVLDESKIPADKKIFRLGEMKSVVLVRTDLAREIYREHTCSGMLFIKIELYGEEFRRED